MRSSAAILLLGAAAMGAAAVAASCTSLQPTSPAEVHLTATPTATPVTTALPDGPPAPDEWNIFPDPTTGRIEVYHWGQHVGSITGDEKEDPPMPHKVDGGNDK